MFLSRNKLNKLLKDSYLVGLSTGYNVGCISGRAEVRNRGAILGGVRVEEEVNEILKKEGF